MTKKKEVEFQPGQQVIILFCLLALKYISSSTYMIISTMLHGYCYNLAINILVIGGLFQRRPPNRLVFVHIFQFCLIDSPWRTIDLDF